MKHPMDVTHPGSRGVRVNLRGADVRVAEQLLDHPQICAVFQQMRCEAMKQHVRCHIA